MKRKTPIRHKVRAHKRQGKTVQSFQRGSGQNLKTSRVVGRKQTDIIIDPKDFGYGSSMPPVRGKYSDYPHISISEDERIAGFVEHPFEFDPSPMFIRTGFEGTKEDFLEFLSEEREKPVTWKEALKGEHKLPRHVFAYFDPQLQGVAKSLYKKGYTTNYSQGYSYNWNKPGEDKTFIHFPMRQLTPEIQRRILEVPGVGISEREHNISTTVALSDKYEDVVTLTPSKPVKIGVIHFKYPRTSSNPPTPSENRFVHDKWMEIVGVM